MLHKQSIALFLIAFLILCLIFVSFGLFEQAGHAQTTPMPHRKTATTPTQRMPVLLTVTDSDDTVILAPGKGKFDFADVDPIDYDDSSDYTLTHTFTLWNNSQQPVTVTNVRCHSPGTLFTVAYEQRSLPITVPKDDGISIQLHYRLFPLVVGEIHTSADIVIAHQKSPAAVLLMDANIKEDVVFTPPSLDFGRISSGQEASQVVKVVYSHQMYSSHLPMADDQLPSLVSDRPFITVKRIAVGSSQGPQTFRYPGAPGMNNGGTVTLPAINDLVSYLVTIKADAPVGAFQSIIWVMPKTGTFGSEVLKTKNIRVQGEIVSKQP